MICSFCCCGGGRHTTARDVYSIPRDFLQEKKINENDYETLVKALLQYVKQGVFPYINEKIVIETSMKKFGWAVNSILKECDLKINSGVLKFAQNNISLFENNKEVFDETNFRNTYIYKLFTENNKIAKEENAKLALFEKGLGFSLYGFFLNTIAMIIKSAK